jgi:hypothetical protein
MALNRIEDASVTRVAYSVRSCKAYRIAEIWSSPGTHRRQRGWPKRAWASSLGGVELSTVIFAGACLGDGDGQRKGDGSHTDEIVQSCSRVWGRMTAKSGVAQSTTSAYCGNYHIALA